MPSSYEHLRSSHKGWIEEYLGGGSKIRQDEWPDGIAAGSRSFIEKVKAILGFRALGRDVIEISEGYQLREGSVPYKALLGPEKGDIGPKNTFFWDINN
jgi:putative transposase